MKIVGLLFLIIGLIGFFVQLEQRKKALSLKSARFTTTAELKETSSAIATEIGSGNWRDYVKLWGKIITNEPIKSDLKGELCVYYNMKVTHEYEETVRKTNSEGKTIYVTEKRSETISQQERSIPFLMEDQQGQIKVNPDGANLPTIKVLDEFQPGNAIGNHISYNNFSLVLKGNDPTGQRRTLGYRYTESILPLGQNILVAGTASDETGELTIVKPINSDQKFIIALKSNEATTAEAENNAKIAFNVMIICDVIGVLLLIFG